MNNANYNDAMTNSKTALYTLVKLTGIEEHECVVKLKYTSSTNGAHIVTQDVFPHVYINLVVVFVILGT